MVTGCGPKLLISRETFHFFQEVLKLQDEIGSGLTSRVRLREGDLATHLEQGVPFLNFVAIPANKKVFQALARRLANLLLAEKPEKKREVTDLKKFLLNPSLDYRDLLEKVAWQNDGELAAMARENRLEVESFNFVLLNLAKPFLRKLAQELKSLIQQEQWQRAYCPVCGWGPSMDKLSANQHRRYLVCSLCETEWLFPRLKCAYCGNEDHQRLGYFRIDGDDGNQVTYCEKCRGYLKTFSHEIAQEEPRPLLKDLETLYLDLLAREQNFIKNPILAEKKAAEN